MKKIAYFLTVFLLFCVSAKAQTYYSHSYLPFSEDVSLKNTSPLTFQSPIESPIHELRAVWLTTIGGLDWPHSYAQSGKSIDKQKKEFCTILDQLHKAGINVVLLQTRVRATTIFPSAMEPWDGCLSGFPGKSPGYDALEFAISECHKRGMQLHAWVVTIPVGKWNATGCKALRSKMPTVIKKIGDDGYMNPEMPQTADYLAKFCAEITRNYDIDGIHLDYIRYPETWGKIKDHNKGRQYITNIVKAINTSVKALKPWIMLSCSPIGKYADVARQWSHGWNARDIVCQDAALWMKEDLIDAVFPMMYFRDNNFYPFAIDWQERSYGKIVVPGLGIYFMSPKEKNWPLTDITRELHVLRQYGMGHAYFRSKFFTDDTKGIYTFAVNEYCPYPSLVPPMKWYKKPIPDAPDYISLENSKLSWSKGKDNSGGPYLRYNVYASSSYPVDTHDPRNLYVVATENTSTVAQDGLYYAITAVDRYGNESASKQMKVAGMQKKDLVMCKDCPFITCHNTLNLSSINRQYGITSSDCTLYLESIQGNIIMTCPVSSNVDVSELAPGMYVLRCIKRIKKKLIPHRLAFVKVER